MTGWHACVGCYCPLLNGANRSWFKCLLKANEGLPCCILFRASQAGFSPAVRTVWVAEGLLSRLAFQRATCLLRDCGNLCPPGSVLLASVSSAACVKVPGQAYAQESLCIWFIYNKIHG